MVSLSYKQEMTPAMVIIAVLAAVGLVGVVGVTIVSPIQQAEAKGCPTLPVKGDPTPQDLKIQKENASTFLIHHAEI